MAHKNNDWLSALEALRSSMPEDSVPDEIQEPEEVQKPLQTARLDIILDRKGRNGKTATIISGFTIPDDDVAALAADLKRSLGTGGSARGSEILIQGDRRNDVLRLLSARSFKARII